MKYILKHWTCPCGYYQDFEPTVELMMKHHRLLNNTCPSCGENPLVESVEPRVYLESHDSESIKLVDVEKKDAQGKTIYDEETSEPETRKLTKSEQDKELAQAEKDVKALENQIVDQVE